MTRFFDQPDTRPRSDLQAELDRQKAEYFARGGTISELPTVASALPLAPMSGHNTEQLYAKAAKRRAKQGNRGNARPRG